MEWKRSEDKQAFPCLHVRDAVKECLMFQIYIEGEDAVGCQQKLNLNQKMEAGLSS